MKKALTLVELLVVVLIVVLLVALTIPILSSAKKSALITESTSNLRQIHVALMLYKEDHSDYPLENIDVLAKSGYLKAPKLLHISSDPVQPGFANRLYECERGSRHLPLENPTSYEDVFLKQRMPDGSIQQLFLNLLRKHDDNPGLVATRVFGKQYEFSVSNCAGLATAFDGFVLRLREDGSVQHAHYRDMNSDGTRRYCWPGIFTDVHPDIVCERNR